MHGASGGNSEIDSSGKKRLYSVRSNKIERQDEDKGHARSSSVKQRPSYVMKIGDIPKAIVDRQQTPTEDEEDDIKINNVENIDPVA